MLPNETYIEKVQRKLEKKQRVIRVAAGEEKADLVIYAGFMTILDESVCRAFANKMMNVHPALIPSFCGKGYYGLHVHEAALKKGVKVSGATVHFVTEECDGGPIILQKAVAVEEGDTPETLQRRIMEQAEWKILPRAAALFCAGRLRVEDGIVHILEENGRDGKEKQNGTF